MAITVATTGDKNLLCPFCDQSFQDKDPLVSHITKLHSLQLSNVAGGLIAQPVQPVQSAVQAAPPPPNQPEQPKPTAYLAAAPSSQPTSVTAKSSQSRNYSASSSKQGDNYVSTTTRYALKNWEPSILISC